MRVLIAAEVILLIGTGPVLAWSQTAGSPYFSNQSPYTLQVKSRVVLTDVTVTDKQGNPVTGLTENDFRLLDNGSAQQVASFEEHRQEATKLAEVSDTPGSYNNEYLQHPPTPVNILLFDTTTIDIVDQMSLFRQMKDFVNNLPPGEQVAVFTRAGDVTVELASFTGDHVTLLNAIGKAIPRLPAPGAWMASDLDTLQQIAVYLQQIPGRKNLLWFTSGSNMFLSPDPMSANIDSGAQRAIYDLLESERIAIYPIDARGLGVVFGPEEMAVAMQQLQMRGDAEATGGTAWINTNGLAQAAQHILATDGDYYTLSYAPNNGNSNDQWHRVKVELANANYELSYRRGYFDDGSNQPQVEGERRTVLRAGGKTVDVEVADDQKPPLVYSVRIAPASSAAPPLPGDSPMKKGETRYVLDYDVPAKDVYAASVEGNEGTDELDVTVSVYNRNGDLVLDRVLKFTLTVDEQKARSLPGARLHFTQTVNLPKGRNYLYLGVRDLTSGGTGIVNAALDVKEPGIGQ